MTTKHFKCGHFWKHLHKQTSVQNQSPDCSMNSSCLVPVYAQAYFCIFGCYFSLPHRQQSIWVKQQEVVSPNTRLCSTLQIWMVQNYTASTFFFLNHKLCRHFQKDIQSQFNDTSLHSHALITHNPLPHPTYGLKTQGSNLSCALS